MFDDYRINLVDEVLNSSHKSNGSYHLMTKGMSSSARKSKEMVVEESRKQRAGVEIHKV